MGRGAHMTEPPPGREAVCDERKVVRTTFRVKTRKDLIAENKQLRDENAELKESVSDYEKHAIEMENAKLKPCKSPQCYGCKFAATSCGLHGPRLYGCMKDCICADYEPVHTGD